MLHGACCSFFFFFNDTPTTEIYPLSLPDALPISKIRARARARLKTMRKLASRNRRRTAADEGENRRDYEQDDRNEENDLCRSEEHTSELQSQSNLVCRLLLEKKKKTSDVHSY